ncbi:hypothetical protein O6P43_002764 [Quillaja saponaria]|uniref:Uncharacterized protein n=1 Tax=Quillaja saponaria TaxID=32244 RepID=A0AAD7VKQ1_QUISA|nr:hypothetical protein O6P43_002764 [Quillaja saponaria]
MFASAREKDSALVYSRTKERVENSKAAVEVPSVPSTKRYTTHQPISTLVYFYNFILVPEFMGLPLSSSTYITVSLGKDSTRPATVENSPCNDYNITFEFQSLFLC